jgi:hypothetical protein
MRSECFAYQSNHKHVSYHILQFPLSFEREKYPKRRNIQERKYYFSGLHACGAYCRSECTLLKQPIRALSSLKTVLSLAKTPRGHFYCSRGGHANARRADGLGLSINLYKEINRQLMEHQKSLTLISSSVQK